MLALTDCYNLLGMGDEFKRIWPAIKLAATVIAICVVLVFVYRWLGKVTVPRDYFSGTLSYEDFSRCGIVRTEKKDRMGCELSTEICSNLRDYVNRRVRVSAQKTECAPGNDLQCDRGAEYNESGFTASQCFGDFTLETVFPPAPN